MFNKAIVRKPCRNMVKGLTDANLGLPEYEKALSQHENYISALQQCGLEVKILEADENYPDSTFVEDTALLTPHCAIITNPGAVSRRGEIISIKEIIKEFYNDIEEIIEPGKLDAGDIMMVGGHYYIGLSQRTNLSGTQQLIGILNNYGMTGSVIKLEKVLHLKTGVNYVENNNMLACGEFLNHPEIKKFNIIEVPEEESYAANSLWINGKVLIPDGFPRTQQKISKVGYTVISVDVSEFQKLDGGLSCLSLRF